MATPPLFVAEYETTWTTNSATLTTSVTTSPGDVLVLNLAASNGGGTFAVTATGGLTWTLRQSIHVSTSWSDAWVWTATASSSATFDVTVTKTGGSPVWGFNVLRYSGSDGIGASSKTNVSAAAGVGVSLGLTTTGANSAITVINADWDALDGASRAYLSVNGAAPTERTYARVSSSTVTNYVATYADAGAAGAKTVGMSAPLGQKYSIIAVEVLGSSGSASYPVSGTAAASSSSSGSVSARLAAAGAAVASSAASGAVGARLGVSGASSAVSGSSASVSSLLPVSGAAHAVSASSLAVAALRPVSGSASAFSDSSGSVAARLAASGSAAGASDSVGAVAALFPVSGVAAVFSSSSGVVSKLVPTRDLHILNASVPVSGWVSGSLTAQPWSTTTLTVREMVRSSPGTAWSAEPIAGEWLTASPDLSVLSGSSPVSAWVVSTPSN